MIRFLAAFAVALSISGCAADSDDPVPAPGQKEPQRDPPAQTLGNQLEQPDDGPNPYEDQAKARPVPLWWIAPAPVEVAGETPSN